MGRHRVIGGAIVTTPEGVFAHYKPAEHMVEPDAWKVVRPVAIRACRAADYHSVASALAAMSATTHFLAWAYGEGLPLDLENVFIPSHVERYCATMFEGLASETRSTRRGYLRRVGRACTHSAAWPPEPKPFADNHTIMPPYSLEEVAALWDAAATQSTERRERIATAILTLGLGAGLKAGEMLHVSAATVGRHPHDPRLVVILLKDRVAPVRARYADTLLGLCDQYPEGPLLGRWNPKAKDPLGAMRSNIRWPEWFIFRPSRLRTTWMADVLTEDLRISEFMKIAGTVSSKSLEVIAPHVPQRLDDNTYLFAAAGLRPGGGT